MGRGDWYRWNKKTTVEDVHQLDIRRLDLRRFDGYIILMWKDGKTVDYLYEGDRVVLLRHHQTIYLTRTKCNYGGERPWFLCPRCAKRVAILYEVDQWFQCRHCHGLPYASQRECEIGRMQRKARKIRRHLGASDNLLEPIYIKPKGMHWKVFRRRRMQEEEG